MCLSEKLYVQRQTERESVGVFLEQRHSLARRLMPQAPKEQIITVLLESLNGSLKKLLRKAHLTLVENLVGKSTQVEQDDREDRRFEAPIATKQEAAAAQVTPTLGLVIPQSQDRTDPRHPPQCRICPGRHWYRD